MAKRYFQKAKVSLTASILKDVFSKINSLTELYHPFSLSFQWGLWAKNTKALKQESIKKKKTLYSYQALQEIIGGFKTAEFGWRWFSSGCRAYLGTSEQLPRSNWRGLREHLCHENHTSASQSALQHLLPSTSLISCTMHRKKPSSGWDHAIEISGSFHTIQKPWCLQCWEGWCFL